MNRVGTFKGNFGRSVVFAAIPVLLLACGTDEASLTQGTAGSAGSTGANAGSAGSTSGSAGSSAGTGGSGNSAGTGGSGGASATGGSGGSSAGSGGSVAGSGGSVAGSGGSVAGSSGSGGSGAVGGSTGATAGSGGSGAIAGSGGTGGSGATAGSGGSAGSGGTPSVCGDGAVTNTEGCDDSNQINGDGCDSNCIIEMGFDCLGEPSVCTEICGDSLIVGNEQCDDANTTNNDGCDSTCQTESGWSCTGSPSVCNTTCGDTITAGLEECDDGNSDDTDACVSGCKNATCGDGFVRAGVEACDDGDQINGNGCNTDCVASGTLLWTQNYTSAGNGPDAWNAVAVDSVGNVIVTGYETVMGQGRNIYVRKYDNAGNVLWSQTFNGPANQDDQGNGVAVTANDDIVIIGSERVPSMMAGQTNTNIAVRMLKGTDGSTIWSQSFDGGLGAFDAGNAVAINKTTGSIYATGAVSNVAGQSSNIWVAKLAPADGAIVWADVVNGMANNEDAGQGIALDGQGSLWVAGTIRDVTNVPADIWVRRYLDNGNSVSATWTQSYNGVANGTDNGRAVMLDSSSNAYVSGFENVTGQAANVWVREFAPDGSTLNTLTYNGAANGNDSGTAIALSPDATFVVAGAEGQANNFSDVWVRKYTVAGAVLWSRTYNGSALNADVANGVAIGANGAIYVAGFENSTAGGQNAWLGRYSP